MLLTIQYPDGARQTCSPDEAGTVRFQVRPCAGVLVLTLNNTGPCLVSDLSVSDPEAGQCISVPENGISCASGFLVMEPQARIRITVPENCRDRAMQFSASMLELPAGNPLPEKLIKLFRDADGRLETARQEIEALRAAGQRLEGAMTFPELSGDPSPETPEYRHLQGLYLQTLRSTSWRITAPLRKLRDCLRVLKGRRK